MAIKRRILRKFYRLKKFKKHFNNKIKIVKNNKLYANSKNSRKILPPKRKYISRIIPIQYFNLLSSENKQKELFFAKHDVKVFANQYSLKILQKQNEDENFQEYLPNDVWKKMTWAKKQAHLKKRRELKAKGFKFKKIKKIPEAMKKRNYKAYFTNTENRPMIKAMYPGAKLCYLLQLLKRARQRAALAHNLIKKPRFYNKRPVSEIWDENEYRDVEDKQQLKNYRKFYNNKLTDVKYLLLKKLPKKIKKRRYV